MIFSKGEMVKVISSENPFFERVGVIIKVTLESSFPFKVEFQYNDIQGFYFFSPGELEFFDNHEKDQERARHGRIKKEVRS